MQRLYTRLFPIVLLSLLAACTRHAPVGPVKDSALLKPGGEILAKYWQATAAQREQLRDSTVSVEFIGRLPRLNKQATLTAIRYLSPEGQVTYKVTGFSGDETVKKEVIARYMTAETQARDDASLTISDENYHFRYKGQQTKQGRTVHVFELKPRQKRVGLFKGELWIDAQTFLPVRETGEFVKNPSVFLKRVRFIRDYRLTDGLAIPSRIASVVETRIVGPAELEIRFENFRRSGARQVALDR